MTPTFTSFKVSDNTFAITTDYKGNSITFNVVVANDESEIPDLVKHHLSYLDNPAPVYPATDPSPSVDLQQVVQQQAEQIQALTERLSALEAS